MQRRQSVGRTIAIVAQWLPWSPNGGAVVTSVVAPWTLWVGQRRHNGGTRGQMHRSNWYKCLHINIFYGARNGRLLCIHSATTAISMHSSCLLWATCEWPTSSATFVRLFQGDHMASMARSERPLCHPWTTMAIFGLLCAINGDLFSFAVAQGRHKGRNTCVKGDLRVSRAPRSLATRMFINILLRLRAHYWSNGRVIRGWLVDTPHRGPGPDLVKSRSREICI